MKAYEFLKAVTDCVAVAGDGCEPPLEPDTMSSQDEGDEEAECEVVFPTGERFSLHAKKLRS